MTNKEELREKWYKYWNEKSIHTDQNWLTPDTHAIINEFIEKILKENIEMMVEGVGSLTPFSIAIPQENLIYNLISKDSVLSIIKQSHD